MKRHSPTQAYRPRSAPKTVEDRDACALYASVHKRAEASHDAIEAALVALEIAASVTLVASFALLLAINRLQSWSARLGTAE